MQLADRRDVRCSSDAFVHRRCGSGGGEVSSAEHSAGRLVSHRLVSDLMSVVCVCSAYYVHMYVHQTREHTAERVGLVLNPDGAARKVPEVSFCEVAAPLTLPGCL
eukprot:COSAG02_NODE_528_length_20698_cov_6.231710_12_plen_106_part_00